MILVKLLMWCPSFDSLGTREVSFGSASFFCWNWCITAINWFSSFLSEVMAEAQALLLPVLTVRILELCVGLLIVNSDSRMVGHDSCGKKMFVNWTSLLSC